ATYATTATTIAADTTRARHPQRCFVAAMPVPLQLEQCCPRHLPEPKQLRQRSFSIFIFVTLQEVTHFIPTPMKFAKVFAPFVFFAPGESPNVFVNQAFNF